MTNQTKWAIVAILVCVGLGAFLFSTHMEKDPEIVKSLQPQEFRCGDGSFFTVQFLSPKQAKISLSGVQFNVEQTITASGARFEGEGRAYWFKGLEASVIDLASDEVVTTCYAKQ